MIFYFLLFRGRQNQWLPGSVWSHFGRPRPGFAPRALRVNIFLVFTTRKGSARNSRLLWSFILKNLFFQKTGQVSGLAPKWGPKLVKKSILTYENLVKIQFLKKFSKTAYTFQLFFGQKSKKVGFQKVDFWPKITFCSEYRARGFWPKWGKNALKMAPFLRWFCISSGVWDNGQKSPKMAIFGHFWDF